MKTVEKASVSLRMVYRFPGNVSQRYLCRRASIVKRGF